MMDVTLSGKLARQRLDRPCRNSALRGGPLGCLRNAVFLAQDVVGDLVHAYGMGPDIFLVLGIFREPRVNDGELQRRIGIRQDRNPLVGMDRRAVIEIRADVDLLDADLSPELADSR